MSKSIPASQLVSGNPSVLSAGGNPLSLNAIFLSSDPSIPLGVALPFATALDLQNYFGATTPEGILGAQYFQGFDGSNKKPGTLYYAQYNTGAIAAFLRSASVAALTLTQLQAFAGTLIATIDGRVVTSANVNLAGATSFTNAAALIQTGLQAAGGIFSGQASFATTVMTVTSVASGTVHTGDVVTATGVPGGTTVSSFGTGTGGVGTYNLSGSVTTEAAEATTIASAATVAYDSQRAAFVVHSPTTGVASTIGFGTGTLAVDLGLTSAAGAVISQGAATAVPATLMNAIIGLTQNWATFMCVTEPALSVKQAFAAWVQTQLDRYLFVVPDSDATIVNANASGSFAVLEAASQPDGIMPIYDNSGNGILGAFACGAIASIDFEQAQGSTTLAYRTAAGLTPEVFDATVAQNILANNYNLYGSYATANDQFNFFQKGTVLGAWKWIQPYVNQIRLNSDLQLAFLELMAALKSFPYTTRGYTLLRAAALDPIKAHLNFGTIQPGVPLSSAQAAEVDNAAGLKISQILTAVGWYLQILPADPITRAARNSPPITLWYTDGGSIQQINFASILVQ